MSLPAPSPSFKAALHHYDGAFDPVVHVLRTSVSRVKKSKIEPLQIISSITASGRAAPTLVLVTTLSLHLLVHKHYTTTILSSYNSHISSFKQRLSKNALLGIHMLSGLAEVFRWHSKAALTGKAPKPDKLDVLFCAAQSLTNLALIKDMGRGVAGITSPFSMPHNCPECHADIATPRRACVSSHGHPPTRKHNHCICEEVSLVARS